MAIRRFEAESDSVRLGATRDLLDRAGFRPVDRHEIVKEYWFKILSKLCL